MSVSTASPSSAYKKTLLRIGIVFVIVMVVLTFFSGTINNLALANVSVTSPQSGSLQKVITADGTFSSPQNVSVYLTAAGKVSDVPVSVGDVVKAGDVLVKMDMSDLQSQIATEQNNLQVMLNNQAKSKLTVSPDYTQQNVKIANDQTSVTAAQATLQAAQQKLSDDKTSGATQDVLTNDQTAIDKATSDLTNAQNNLKVDQDSLAHTKKQDANSKKSASYDAANTAINIQAEQNKIATLQQELTDNTEVKAPVDGRIQSISAQVGQQAGTSQPILTMLDSSKGLQFSVDVSNDDAALLQTGDQMDIHLTGLSASVNGTITDIKDSTSQPGAMMTVWFDTDTQGVLDNNVQPSQKGDIRFSSNTNSYNMTLPNGSIREDSSGYFVLTVQQSSTPLGKSYVLRRVDVTVLDSDSYNSAVSGALNMRDQVVTSSDKSVSDGDTVRLAS